MALKITRIVEDRETGNENTTIARAEWSTSLDRELTRWKENTERIRETNGVHHQIKEQVRLNWNLCIQSNVTFPS